MKIDIDKELRTPFVTDTMIKNKDHHINSIANVISIRGTVIVPIRHDLEHITDGVGFIIQYNGTDILTASCLHRLFNYSLGHILSNDIFKKGFSIDGDDIIMEENDFTYKVAYTDKYINNGYINLYTYLINKINGVSKYKELSLTDDDIKVVMKTACKMFYEQLADLSFSGIKGFK